MEIFKSCFTLGFKDKKLEEEYKEVVLSNLKRLNKIYTHISLGILVIANISLYTFYNSRNESERISYPVVFYSSIALFLISAFASFLVSYFKIRYKVHKMICYYYCVCLYFSFSFIRYSAFTHYKQNEGILYLLILLEFATRIFIIFSGLVGFLETLFISGCLVISFLAFYSPIISWWRTLPYSFILYMIFVTFTILFSYFMAREQRRSFYFNNIIKKNVLWYENIFDKSSFGFLQISDNKILFANKLMKTKLMNGLYVDHNNINDNYDLMRNSSVLGTSVINGRYDAIIKELFSKIEASIINHSDQNEGNNWNINSEQSYNNDLFFSNKFLLQLKGHFIDKNEDNFIYLGIKTFQVKDCLVNEEYAFEVLYRYYNNGRDNFEFIFNDITRTREEEKKNAEFKYKALYLAKVAHEFKNPLICISEVVEKCNDISTQIKENVNDIEEIKESFSKLEENLFLINSFSKYLIMLVKDLDYFSSYQTNTKNKPLTITKINLDDLLKFVSDITRGLIIKSNKSNTVRFVFHKDDDIPETISTDDIKLKQVLINLCSNAVKFTNAGRISLEVLKMDNKIRFKIEDTGVGISEERMKGIFKPFSTDVNSKNLLGSGLGLSIVSDITAKFGSPIQLESVLGAGSKFWFDLSIESTRPCEFKHAREIVNPLSSPIQSN